jgi:thymidylate synthase
MNSEWTKTLGLLMARGVYAEPRGKATLEIPQHTVTIPMRYPVLTIPERKLSYQFMAAEAYWIMSGDNTVAGIAPWNSRIADFSDDGIKFFGAYGPKVVTQLDYVVEKLVADRDSRQAGLTIWRENPPETKDVPCTIALFASIRHSKVNLHVFMRSSDVWLGLPYDVFNFSMLAHMICCRINSHASEPDEVVPGTLYLTAASSHLYEVHWAEAEVISSYSHSIAPNETPEFMHKTEDGLMALLKDLRDSRTGSDLRWWENHAA